MRVVHKRCAGLDVHQKSITACVRVASKRKVVRETRVFGTATSELLEMLDWLGQCGCTIVAMEATGVCRTANDSRRPRAFDEIEGSRHAARGSRRDQNPLSPSRLQRQSLLRELVQNSQVSSRFPGAFRFRAARPRVVPRFLLLVQHRTPPLRHWPDDSRGGAPRPGLNSSTRTVGRSSPRFLTLTPSVSSRVGPNLRICRSQPGSTRRQTTRRSRLAQERRWSHRTTWRYPRVASLTGILPDPISTPPRPTPGAELSSKSDWSLIRRSIRMAPSCAPKHERELTKCRDFVSQNH